MKKIAALLLGLAFATSAFGASPKVVILVDELYGILDYGRHRDLSTVSSYSMSMVREFIRDSYDADEELFKYVEWAETVEVDEMIAGTMKFAGALSAGEDAASWLAEFDDGDEEASEARRKRILGLIRQLKDQPGVYFGFDGYEQSGCACPTVFMLVLDTEGKHVFGIDMTPCTES